MINPEVTSTEIVSAFYLGLKADSEGRMIEDIWRWDYQKLEYIHNYIQWLFPFRERSNFNIDAPILNDKVILLFRENDLLRQRLTRSLNLMLKFFYGLET